MTATVHQRLHSSAACVSSYVMTEEYTCATFRHTCRSLANQNDGTISQAILGASCVRWVGALMGFYEH